MPKFNVLVVRTEAWVSRVEVEANTMEEAVEKTNETLAVEGWDAVCDDDGNCTQCRSEAFPCTDL